MTTSMTTHDYHAIRPSTSMTTITYQRLPARLDHPYDHQYELQYGHRTLTSSAITNPATGITTSAAVSTTTAATGRVTSLQYCSLTATPTI